MRRVLLFFLCFCLVALLLPALTFGNPFLTADSQVNVDEYRIVMNGVDLGLHPVKPVGGSEVVLWFDLSGIAEGTHSVRVAAKNIWGESGLSIPFDFNKEIPTAPTGLRVSLEP